SLDREEPGAHDVSCAHRRHHRRPIRAIRRAIVPRARSTVGPRRTMAAMPRAREPPLSSPGAPRASQNGGPTVGMAVQPLTPPRASLVASRSLGRLLGLDRLAFL